MWIYAGVMFVYGMLIMMAFLSVQDMFTEPMTELNGLKITEIDRDPADNQVFNLNWTTEANIASHVALGMNTEAEGFDFNATMEKVNSINESVMKEISEFMKNISDIESLLEDNPLLMEFFGEEYVDGLESRPNYTYPIPLDNFLPGMELHGIELVYIGGLTQIDFVNNGDSNMFIVILISNDWNLYNSIYRGPVYTSELDVGSEIDKLMEDNPMIKILLGDEMVSFTEIDGFMAIEYFSMWPLMLLIFLAIKTGATVSKHVDDQSIDILLATGYSRFRFLNEKMLVVLVNMVLVVFGAWLGLVLGVLMIGEPVPLVGTTFAFLGSIPMAIGMIGISLLISVKVDEASKATGAIMGVTIFMFMIQIVSNIAGWQDGIGYISLFRYYNMIELMTSHIFDLVNVIVPMAIGILSIIGAYILFWKKDIHT
jgi:ABC-type transport system involved in multi-copper enzyme maturation permease subunit